ncbi:unnamed protein product [Calypogeia fissa]
MERDRELLTHLVLRSVVLTLLVLLCCSIVSFAQNSIVSPPLRQHRSWIVGHRGLNVNATQSVVPGCKDLCLNAISPAYGETLVGLSVQLYSCQDSDNSLFQYDDVSKAITMWDPTFNVNRCLDAGQYPSTAGYSLFTLQECNNNATNQQWTFQADGQIRSGLVNSSSTSFSTQPLYMQGISRQPEDWGTGWNTFGLYLSTGANPDTISSFSLLAYASPSPSVVSETSLVAQPSNGNADVIMNGDFESCGYDPGQSSVADFSSSTWWFIICYWTISSGSVQLVSSGLWQDDPKGGNATLHLNGYNGPGAVTQITSTNAGSNYSLSFDLAGDVTRWCGSTTKTLNVSINPSSLPLFSFSFDVSGKTAETLGWISPPQLNFTAYGTSVNFTFQSTTGGICGPLIDNVSLQKYADISPRADDSATDSILMKVLTATVSVVALGVLIPTLFCCYLIWRKKHGGDLETHFVKGIRCQSEMDVLDTGFKGPGCESFSCTYGTQYSWEDLEKATSNFGKVLGNGRSGLLFLAEFPDGLLGAVKVDTHQRQWTSDEAFKQEVAILYRLHHAYLVSFIGVCVGRGSRRALVFEYMPNGNLFDRLHNLQDSEPLSWQTRMVIAYQVACALEYLHEEASPSIVHRDVQASNVLLQRDDSAKLAAFDVSRTGRSSIISSHSSVDLTNDAPMKKVSMSYGYLDPAYNRSGRVSKKSDVYSYGALLLEIITGLPAAEFDLKSFGTADFSKMKEEMVNIVDPKLMGKFNENELNEVIDIAVKCLKAEAKSRPSMSDVVVMLKEVFSSARPFQ